MSTFWQVLRLAFWINPLQRVLTCIGLATIVLGSVHTLGFGLPGSTLPGPFLGVFFVSAASVLVGGVYLRLVSAPRIVRLAPRGRLRLLLSVLGLVLLIAILWMSQYWLFFLLWVDPKFHPSLASQLAGLADSAVVTSTALVGLFIASRSPLAAFAVLLVLVAPGMAEVLFDADLRARGGVQGTLITLGLIWIPFAVWYLRVRRIGTPRWLASGGEDVLATTLISTAKPQSQREALERLLLGGTTVMRLGMQWFLVLGLLLGLQWILAQVGEPRDPALVARVMLASLCILPVVTTLVSFAAIRRARSIWLLTASSRGEFFDRIERVLIRLNLVLALVFVGWLGVLWLTQSQQLDSALDQGAVAHWQWFALWVAGWFAINMQLAGFPKWPTAVVLASVLVFAWWVFEDAADHAAVAGAGRVIATTLLLTVSMFAIVALRWFAQRRWCNGDLPRSAAVMVS